MNRDLKTSAMNAKFLISFLLLVAGRLQAQDDPKLEIARIAAIENGAERLGAYDALAVKLGVGPTSGSIVDVAPGQQAKLPSPNSARGSAPSGDAGNGSVSSVYDAPQSPGYDALRHHANLRNTWIKYHVAIARLELSLDGQKRLINLLCARVEAVNDAHEAAVSLGVGNQQDIRQSLSDAYKSITSEIRGMIGDAGTQSLDEDIQMDGTVAVYMSTVGADLGLDGVPMTEDQEIALGQIYFRVLHTPLKTAPDKYSQLPVDPQTGLSEVDQNILDRASRILSLQQLASLRNSMLTAHREMRFLIQHGAVQVR
jgi:hypothetical protein